MGLDIEQLLCSGCGSYVHPFLAPCPRCGRERPSRYEDVLGGASLDVADLCADPDTLGTARSVLRSGGLAASLGSIAGGTGATQDPVDEIAGLLGELAGRVQYRTLVRGDRRAGNGGGRLEIAGQRLVLRASGDRSPSLGVPLSRVLAATPLGGRFGDEGSPLHLPLLRPSPGRGPDTALGGDLVILYATDDGVAQLALANPSGLFATKARPDHYRLLARWLGLTAAAFAERDWRQHGPRAHARDLGFDVGPEPVAPAPAEASREGAAGPSVRAALEELEGLRSAGLVTGAEYETKRREILARL